MKRTIFLMTFISLCALAGAQTVVATADSALGGVVDGPVTAEAVVRAAKTDAAAAGTLQRITATDLRRMGGLAVADALRQFAGVQVKDYGGIGGLKTVNVHGLGSEHVGVTYNGVRLNNAMNGQIDLGRFSLDNVESISLLEGDAPDLLHPAADYASAATINLQTRTPVFAPRGGVGNTRGNGGATSSDVRPYNVRAAVRGGSFGLINPSLRWEQRMSGNVSASFSSEYLHATGRYRYRYRRDGGYDTTATRRNGDVEAVRGEAALFGRLPRGRWTAQGYVYGSRRGLPGAVVRGRMSNVDRQNDVTAFAQASLRQDFGRYSLLVNAKYSHDYLHYRHDARLDNSTMDYDNRYRSREVYISAAQRYAFAKNWSAALSADYLMNGMEADLHNFARPLRHSICLAPAVAWTPRRATLHGALTMTHADNRVRHTGAGTSARFTEWTPLLSATWRPFAWRGITLRALCKGVFRMPTLNDLYYTLLGNSALRPERATHYDAGITWRRTFSGGMVRSAEVKVDAYRHDVSDKIVAVPTANLFRWSMTNIGRARIDGADIAARVDGTVGEVGVSIRGTYTYQRAEDRTDRRSPYYRGQIAYIPRHAATLAAGIDLRRWTLNYSCLYTGERFDASANIAANRVPPVAIHDASLSRTFTAGGVTACAMLAVNNLFGRQYEIVRCYPMPGRNVKLSLTLSL